MTLPSRQHHHGLGLLGLLEIARRVPIRDQCLIHEILLAVTQNRMDSLARVYNYL
jgi:hypothetical protein